MSTKFQKKKVSKKSSPEKKEKKVKLYLYYSPSKPLSIKLLNILALLPRLAKKIKCVSVLEYDVDGIKTTPAIDDGVSKKPHELDAAFQWVLDECYRMDDLGLLERDTVVQVEDEIRAIMRSSKAEMDRSPRQVIDRGYMRINKDEPNPMDQWASTTVVDSLSSADYSGVNIHDRYMDLQQKHYQKEMDGTLKAERMKNSEAYRMQLMESAQREWRKRGLVDENGNPRQREILKREGSRGVSITPSDLKRYEDERANMGARYKDGPPAARPPISRSAGHIVSRNNEQ
jgi:hypothetical protein